LDAPAFLFGIFRNIRQRAVRRALRPTEASPATPLFHRREAKTRSMAENNLGFQEYLKKEIEHTKGIYVPVRAGFLRRLLIRRAACK